MPGNNPPIKYGALSYKAKQVANVPAHCCFVNGRFRIVECFHSLFVSRNKFAREKALNCFSQREIFETPHVVSYQYRCLASSSTLVEINGLAIWVKVSVVFGAAAAIGFLAGVRRSGNSCDGIRHYFLSIGLQVRLMSSARKARAAGRARDFKPATAKHAAPSPAPAMKPMMTGQVRFAL